MARNTSLIVHVTPFQVRKIQGRGQVPIRIKVRRRRGEPLQDFHGLLVLPPRLDGAGDGFVSVDEGDSETAEERYRMILGAVEEVLGEDETSKQELNRFGTNHVEGWMGVFDRDEQMPRASDGPLLGVKNTGTYQEGGEHWVAIYRDPHRTVAYDSFGRQVYLDGVPLESPEDDAEQSSGESNCGQRCLAWLLLVQDQGIDAAMSI